MEVLDDDVYVWTSIVDRWLDTVRGEPSAQLTFIVSLLRGAAYEWYMQYETCTGCPGDWTTMRQAMLKRFGSSIRVEKARAGIYQLRQDKMTVLQYADAFESFLAQIEDFDESQYLIQFIFGLRPEISRLVYPQQPASILAAKEMAERLELTHQAAVMHQKRSLKRKRRTKQSGIVAPRSGELAGGSEISRKTFSAVRQQKENQYHSMLAVNPLNTGAFIEASCPRKSWTGSCVEVFD